MRPRSALAAALLLAAAPASAHVRLVSPPSRYGDEMKAGPCGRPGGLRSATVSTFAPGQVITVSFEELLDHPGYYRIAFDPAGDTALAPPTWDAGAQAWSNPAGVLVLADPIADTSGVPTHGLVAVTLPDVECDACTLQLIQVMTDKPPFDGLDDFYFQCADLVLTRTPGAPPPPPAAPPAAPSGGCESSGSPGAGAGLVILVVLALARRAHGGRALGRR